MELGESEALGIEDDHDGGVGYVHANLDDCGGYEYLCLSVDEFLHFLFFFLGLHLSMNFTEMEFWECFTQNLKSVFQVLEVALLAFFYQREHEIYLSALFYLLADTIVEAWHITI